MIAEAIVGELVPEVPVGVTSATPDAIVGA